MRHAVPPRARRRQARAIASPATGDPQTARPARLIIAGAHPMVLDGLQALLTLEPGIEVTARCREVDETVLAVMRLEPDLLLLDSRMQGRATLEVLLELRARGLSVPVLLLVTAFQDAGLEAALRLGVAGVVLKEAAPETLVAAVLQVRSGGEWLEGLGGPALRA